MLSLRGATLSLGLSFPFVPLVSFLALPLVALVGFDSLSLVALCPFLVGLSHLLVLAFGESEVTPPS